jgi:hypothetical protein
MWGEISSYIKVQHPVAKLLIPRMINLERFRFCLTVIVRDNTEDEIQFLIREEFKSYNWWLNFKKTEDYWHGHYANEIDQKLDFFRKIIIKCPCGRIVKRRSLTNHQKSQVCIRITQSNKIRREDGTELQEQRNKEIFLRKNYKHTVY